MKVVWDAEAKTSFRKYLEYIKADSVQAAEKVRIDILKTIRNLPQHPEMFPVDRFKNENNGNYRAFEKFSCRIAYLVTVKEIRI